MPNEQFHNIFVALADCNIKRGITVFVHGINSGTFFNQLIYLLHVFFFAASCKGSPAAYPIEENMITKKYNIIRLACLPKLNITHLLVI